MTVTVTSRTLAGTVFEQDALFQRDKCKGNYKPDAPPLVGGTPAAPSPVSGRSSGLGRRSGSC